MNITFIGGGNIASAIIGGLVRQSFDARLVRVVEIDPGLRAQLAQRFGVAAFADTGQLPVTGDVVVMAVKPQQMRTAAGPLAPRLRQELVLSVAAGIRIADLARWLGGYGRIVRCMPNTPALIGAGITAAYAAPAVTPGERTLSENILGAVGGVIWVETEALLDAVTAVSGSGPAYVFYFIEALREAAQQLGLAASAANTLAVETFLGAAKLAAQSQDDVAALRARVTSRGGTTERALASMTADQISQRIVKAVRAAEQRSRELGAEFGND